MTNPSAAAEIRCRELIARSRSLVFDDPAAALAAAVEASEVADGMSAKDRLRQAELADLRAEAWAYRGNALRVVTDLDAADAALRRAEDERSSGTGRAELAARLLSLRASLDTPRGRYAEALEALDAAIPVCGSEDTDLLAQLKVKKGFVLYEMGRYTESICVAREALRLLRPHEQLRLFAFAAHNLACALHKIGYSIAARSVIAELRPLHERLGDRLTLLRLDWLEATIDSELGVTVRAEEKLRRVRDRMLEQDLAYDAALVSLDLAALYAGQHRFPEIRQLAIEMFPIFQSRRIHREALAAIILFRESIAGGRADLALLGEVRHYLQLARHDRALRFRRGR